MYIKSISIIIIGLLIIISIENTNASYFYNDEIIISQPSQPLDEGDEGNIDWWPMFNHDPQHSGYTTSTGPDINNILWELDLCDNIVGSPVIVNDIIIVATICTGGSYILAFNASTHYALWGKHIDYTPVGSPAVWQDFVIISTIKNNDGLLYALNIYDNGNQEWVFPTTGVPSSPTIYYNMIFIGTSKAKVYAISVMGGNDPIWSYSVADSSASISSIAIDDDKVFFGTNHKDPMYYGKVYALDAIDGSFKWETTSNSIFGSVSSIAVSDGKVIFSTSDSMVYANNADTGKNIWQFGHWYGSISPPAVAYGKIFIGTEKGKDGSSDGLVYALNADTGGFLWEYSFKDGSGSVSSPVVADGKVYVGTSGKYIYALNESNSKQYNTYKDVLWSYFTKGAVSSPAIANHKLYVFSNNYGIYCFCNKKPNMPIITGPTNVNGQYSYEYKFVSTDPGGDYIDLYQIHWGDGIFGDIDGAPSGVPITVSHFWEQKGIYTIKARAKDINGDWSNWGQLEVTVPKEYSDYYDETSSQSSSGSYQYQQYSSQPLIQTLVQQLMIRGQSANT